MRTHKPIGEVAGIAETYTITVSRVVGNPLYHLVFDIDGRMERVKVKQTRLNGERHGLEINYTKEDEESDAELFAVYRDGTVYVIPRDEMPNPGSTMNLTLRSRYEIDNAGARAQANFSEDYTLSEYVTAVRAGEE